MPSIFVSIFNEFYHLIILVFPYFLLGAVFGALLKTYLKPSFGLKYLGGGFLSVVYASLLGAILPGCSCATMPMADGLKGKGVKLGTITSFVMVSPLLSPQTVFLTYGVLGLKFTVARVIFALSSGIIIGTLFNYLEAKKVKGFVLSETEENTAGKISEETACDCQDDYENEQRKGFWLNLMEIMMEIGKYFILGMLIGSLFTVFIPEEAISRYLGGSSIASYLLAALIGIPLYVCEGEEIPITASLMKLGLWAGPAMTFLLGSVGTCVATIVMSKKLIGKRPTIAYTIYWFVFALVTGLLFNLFY